MEARDKREAATNVVDSNLALGNADIQNDNRYVQNIKLNTGKQVSRAYLVLSAAWVFCLHLSRIASSFFH